MLLRKQSTLLPGTGAKMGFSSKVMGLKFMQRAKEKETLQKSSEAAAVETERKKNEEQWSNADAASALGGCRVVVEVRAWWDNCA